MINWSPATPYVLSVPMPDNVIIVGLMALLVVLLIWKVLVFIKQTFLF